MFLEAIFAKESESVKKSSDMDREDRIETVYHCRKFASLTVGFHLSLIKIRFVKFVILLFLSCFFQ